jgi:hypothetical protein
MHDPGRFLAWLSCVKVVLRQTQWREEGWCRSDPQSCIAKFACLLT